MVARLPLPQVTLCAVSSVNIAATVHALETSLSQVDFAADETNLDASVLR